MNKPDPIADLPPDWDMTDADHWRIAEERAAEFDRTGLGYTLEDVEAFFAARRLDPNAPCPPPRKLR